jgi:hypothetical protein
MRIIFLLTLTFFLASCSVTPRLLLGETTGISFALTPNSAKEVEPEDSSNFTVFHHNDSTSQDEAYEAQEELERRRNNRRRALNWTLYSFIGAASIGTIVYLLAFVDSEDAGCPYGECYVSGYTRNNGTYVDGYCRSC